MPCNMESKLLKEGSMMRLKTIEIRDFGMFHNYKLEFDSQAQIIYGNNEKGKTTLMSFILLMLYGNQGRETKKHMTLRKKYLPWNGAKMAGSLTFSNAGKNYRVEKKFGNTFRKDEVRLIDVDNASDIDLGNKEEIGEFVLGIDQDSFLKTGFISGTGFFNGKGTDQITSYLVQNLAQTGDEDVSADDVWQRLTNARYALVSKSNRVGKLLDEENRLENLKQEEAETKALLEQQTDKTKQLENLGQKRLRRHELKARLKKDNQVRQIGKRQDLLTGLNQLDKKEQVLAKYPVSLAKMDQFIQKGDECSIKAQGASDQLSGFTAEKNDQPNIPVIERELEEAKKLTVKQGELTTVNQYFENVVEPSKERVEKEQQSLDTLTQQEKDKEGQLQELKTDKEKYDQTQKELLAGNQKVQALRDSKDDLLARKAKFERENAAKEEHRRSDSIQSSNDNKLTMIGGVVAVVGLIALFISGLLGVVLLIAGIGIVVYDQTQRNNGQTRAANETVTTPVQPREDFEQQQAKLEEQLEAAKQKVTELTQQIEALQGQNDRYMELENEIKQIKFNLSSVQESVTGSKQEFGKVQNKWRSKIMNAELADIDQSMVDLAEVKDSLQKACQAVNEHLNVILQKYEVEDVPALEALHNIQKQQEKRRVRYTELKEKASNTLQDLSDLFSKFPTAPQNLADCKLVLEQLKKEFQDYKDAKRMVEQQRKATGITDNREQLEESLKDGHQVEPLSREKREQLQDELQTIDPHIEQEFYELQNGIVVPERNLDELAEAISEHQAEVDRLTKSKDALDLAIQVFNNTLEERRKNFAPELRKLVGKYLNMLTDGRYDDVMIPKTYELEVQSEGLYRQYNYLSSGTVDQSYLALRFAVANLLTSLDQDALPMILDDVLREYDETRATNALHFLKKQDDRHQLLMFTCHKSLCPIGEEAGFVVSEL